MISFNELLHAWTTMSAKTRAKGADQVSLSDFSLDLHGQLRKLHEELKGGTYRPMPASIFEKDRNIAVFPVRDRLVRYSLLPDLSALYARVAIPSNFGYIAGRSAVQAVDAVLARIEVEKGASTEEPGAFFRADIADFFPSILFEKLMDVLLNLGYPPEQMSLLDMLLRSPRLSPSLELQTPDKGLLLGCPLSPVLSNLYLSGIDPFVQKSTLFYVRFSDDSLIQEKVGTPILKELTDRLAELGLALNPMKTGRVDLKSGFVFLGYEFRKPSERIIQEPSRVERILEEEGKDDHEDWFNWVLQLDPEIPTEGGVMVREALARKSQRLGLVAVLLGDEGLEGGDDAAERLATLLSPLCINRLVELRDSPHPFSQRIENLVDYLVENGMFSLADEINRIQTGMPDAEPESSARGQDEQWLERFLGLFSGREGSYAKGFLNSEGKRAYYRIGRSLDLDALTKCRSTRTSLAVYPVWKDDTTAFSVLDLDADHRLLEQAGEQGQDAIRERALEIALELHDQLASYGLDPLLVDSGGKGFHLWIFWDHRMSVDATCRALLDRTASVTIPEGFHLDIIPTLGYEDDELVKLPLSHHEKTGNLCSFLDESGHPVHDIAALLASVVRITLPEVDDGEDLFGSSEPAGNLQDSTEFPDYVLAVEKNCPLMASIVEKAVQSKWLTHYERYALMSVYGVMGAEGRRYVHEVVGKTLNYRQVITEGWLDTRKGKPVGCNKLRLRFPDRCCREPCTFPEYPLFYPTPVLYGYPLNPSVITRPDFEDAVTRKELLERIDDRIRVGVLAEKYIEICKRKREIDRALHSCSEDLENLYSRLGVTEWETERGRLLRRDGEWLIRVE
jgi:hypothetical protein